MDRRPSYWCAATTAMLDEGHDQPCAFTQHPADSNVYTWGKMGNHNIVIAFLPVWVYGTVSAATTAMSMLLSLLLVEKRCRGSLIA